MQSFNGLSQKQQSVVLLHIAVILFGFTAILGDLIQIKALYLVWWRVLFTTLSLAFLLRWFGVSFNLTRKSFLIFIGIGFLVGIHWLCFYGSIKISNASFTLICMATTSLFTSLLEPLFFRKRIRMLELSVGLIIVPCMYLIVGTDGKYSVFGVVVGLLSAFFAALFTVLNKKYIEGHHTLRVSLYEMFGVFLLMSLVMPFMPNAATDLIPAPTDWLYLLILSLVCTTLAWVISLRALRHVSAFESNVIVNLEPVYGILLAIFILNEHQELNTNFYIGAAIIMVVAVLFPWMGGGR